MECEVIVFDEHTVKQSHAVIHAAAACDGIFVEQSEAGNRLTRIHDPCASALNTINILTR